MPETKSLEALLKEGLLRKGSDEKLVLQRFPTGLNALDTLFGGGVPIGRCIEFYGPESTGKTLLAQYITAAVQKTSKPQALLLDLEHGFDAAWWKQSGVDTDKLLVSSPATGEQAIDIMVAMVENCDDLGLIILDSIPGLIPTPLADTENLSDGKAVHQPGMQAKLVTMMYHRLIGPLSDKGITFLVTNQMRENIGGYDELAALPGGRAQRHYNQIILRTRRDDWIKNSKGERTGFYMDITQRKNKTCSIPDGTNIMLPFQAAGQIDMLTAFVEEAVKREIITKGGPYYKWATQKFLGMPALRNFFLDNPSELKQLEEQLTIAS